MADRESKQTILRVEDVTIRFGGLVALDSIHLDVKEGEVHGIIGPNGSGKTTLFNVISGLYRQERGHIYLAGQCMDGIMPHQRAKLGLNRSFQHQRTFGGMTVLENVLMGQHKSLKYNTWDAVFNRNKAKIQEQRAIAWAIECLKFVNLHQYAHRKISDLAYVEQRLVEVSRALATEQVIMLLDEPAAGLSQNTVSELDDILMKIREEKRISILVVEHVLPLVFKISDHITVFNQGKKIAEGTPEEIRVNKEVTEAYVGKDDLLEGIVQEFREDFSQC